MSASAASLLLAAACAVGGGGGDGGDGGTAPPAPDGITAQAGSAHSVHVMWNQPGDTEAVGGYEVYQGGVKVKEVPGSQHMVDITGLEPSSAYRFTVRARDAKGNLSPQSAETTATTLAAETDDRVPPTRPATLRGHAEGSHAASLTWGRSTDNLGVTSYEIYQGGVKIHSVPGSQTTTLLTGLRPGTAYAFTVRARDAADNVSPAGPVLRLTTASAPGSGPSTAPAAFRVRSRADSGTHYLDLSWTPPQTDGAITEYQIYLDGQYTTTLAWGADAPSGTVGYSLPVGDRPHPRYAVKVRARLPDGTWGAFSAQRTVTTTGS
ncbi:fibronectin type III domain-containing protein [Peterkaempfera bronchialis]|uniref:fibronectin type III domain-containing protein n=1 Tax=Peterkaempfera bronchialis TaxID=2126346 RepID=UPI003C2B9560